MSEPIHVIVTLSPETIAEIKAFLLGVADFRPAAREVEPCNAEPALLYRKPCAREVSSVALDDVRRALEGRAEVTIREVLEALGVPTERWDRSMATAAGAALRRLGWTVAGQRGSGARERYYRPAAK